MSNAESKNNNKARMRSLMWMEMLWEGTNTTAREERRKEEILVLLRGLVENSNSKREVREYVPWGPLW